MAKNFNLNVAESTIQRLVFDAAMRWYYERERRPWNDSKQWEKFEKAVEKAAAWERKHARPRASR